MNLFSSHIAPSPICLGTAVFGTSEIPEDASFALLDTYVELGGNVIDTAHIYAAWIPDGWGASERTIGKWLHARNARNQVILSTKGAHPPMDNMAVGHCTEHAIRMDAQESLDRLAIDKVDLYWLHRDDERVPVGEIVDIMAALVKEGLIGCYGASNWSCARIEAANTYATAKGVPGFSANQPGWSLVDRAPGPVPVGGMVYLDEPGRQWHIRTGLPVMAYSSQGRGYFGNENSTWARKNFDGTAPRGNEYDCPESRRRLSRAIALAEQKNCTPSQIALAYLLHQPFPVFPIIGTGKEDHLRESVAATSVALSEIEWHSLLVE